MANFKDLFDVHLKYVEYLLAKSHLSHQYLKNISFSGREVEGEIRALLSDILPGRFRVTFGYIVYAKDSINEPTISPEVDMIIVDNLVPNSLFAVDKVGGMEVVPVEAVVGIFEIKRTLNKEELSKAVKHLREVVSSVSIRQDDEQRYFPGGVPIGPSMNGGFLSNPIIGILGLSHDEGDFTEPALSEFLKKSRQNNEWLDIDLVASFQGLFCTIADPNNSSSYLISNLKERATTYSYVRLSDGRDHQNRVVSSILGYILVYLSLSSGKGGITPQHYWFNKTII